MTLFFVLFAPFLAALMILFLRKEARFLVECVALGAQGVSFLASISATLAVSRGETVILGDLFRLDPLGAWFLLIVSGIGLFAAFHSVGYLREETKKGIIGLARVRQYYLLFELFLFAMLVAVLADYPILLWIAIEATTLSTVFLISFYNKQSATEAAWKYLLLNSLGLLLGLLGTMLFLSLPYNGVSIPNWSGLELAAKNGLSPLAAKIAFVFVLVGFGTKVGLAPMHTWLPDGHSKAPSPISALLSGVLLNVAFFAILRFREVMEAANGVEFVNQTLLFFGFLSLGLSALIILVQKNYKRLLAYSSVDHMGIAALGFGFGGAAVLPALLHLFYHSILKSLLFFSAGNIFLKYGSTKIENIRGVLQALPSTGVVFFATSLALLGMPPFGMFFTKFGILSSGFVEHPYLVSFALFFLAVLFFGFIRSVTGMLFGPVPEGVTIGESNRLTVWPVILLFLFSVIFSWWLVPPLEHILSGGADILTSRH